MRHLILHVAGCALPLLAIFLLPLFGIDGGVTLLVFIVLMFACHLFMMRGHGHEHNQNSADTGGRTHEHS